MEQEFEPEEQDTALVGAEPSQLAVPRDASDADAVADLDRLAVIEAELAEAEAELDSMDNPAVDQDPSPDL